MTVPRDGGATARHAPTPVVGRTGERALLRALAERAADGTRSAVLVRGEAGIGKSRLVATLAATAADELGMAVVTCACDPYHRGSALYPVLAGLREHGIALPDGGAALARMSPQRRRREALVAVAGALCLAADEAPLLVVVEDLHWADPSTLELLAALLDGPRDVALMLALTARSDYVGPANPSLQRIELGRLDAEESLRLVERVAAEGRLPDGVAADLAARAGGSPLLAEELTRTVLATQDAGPHAGHALRLPHGAPGARHDGARRRPARGDDRPRVRRHAAARDRHDRTLGAGLGAGAARPGGRHRRGRTGPLRLSPRPAAGRGAQLAAQARRCAATTFRSRGRCWRTSPTSPPPSPSGSRATSSTPASCPRRCATGALPASRRSPSTR